MCVHAIAYFDVHTVNDTKAWEKATEAALYAKYYPHLPIELHVILYGMLGIWRGGGLLPPGPLPPPVLSEVV